MKGDGHDATGLVKCLLDAVAVVDVNVNVLDAGVDPETVEDGEVDVVDVAEARGLEALGVVESAGPVDGDVGLLGGDFAGTLHGGAGRVAAKVVEAVKDGTVIDANVEPGEEL